MISAKLHVKTSNTRISNSIILAVQPDNTMKGLAVRGRATRNGVAFTIVFDGRIETFISTLDDLVQCLQAAIGTLNNLPRRNKE